MMRLLGIRRGFNVFLVDFFLVFFPFRKFALAPVPLSLNFQTASLSHDAVPIGLTISFKRLSLTSLKTATIRNVEPYVMSLQVPLEQ